jgi:hypothetical protein
MTEEGRKVTEEGWDRRNGVSLPPLEDEAGSGGRGGMVGKVRKQQP